MSNNDSLDELLQLRLYVRDLGPLELELVEGDPGALQVALEAELLGGEDEEGAPAAALAPGKKQRGN